MYLQGPADLRHLTTLNGDVKEIFVGIHDMLFSDRYLGSLLAL